MGVNDGAVEQTGQQGAGLGSYVEGHPPVILFHFEEEVHVLFFESLEKRLPVGDEQGVVEEFQIGLDQEQHPAFRPLDQGFDVRAQADAEHDEAEALGFYRLDGEIDALVGGAPQDLVGEWAGDVVQRARPRRCYAHPERFFEVFVDLPLGITFRAGAVETLAAEFDVHIPVFVVDQRGMGFLERRQHLVDGSELALKGGEISLEQFALAGFLFSCGRLFSACCLCFAGRFFSASRRCRHMFQPREFENLAGVPPRR